jgi:hypothetical protein
MKINKVNVTDSKGNFNTSINIKGKPGKVK